MKKVYSFWILLIAVNYAQIVGPKISVQPMNFDFGDIKYGDTVTHDFVALNTGGDILIIKDVRASCGCTAVKPDKTELKPGESTNIKVQFNTIGREGKQSKHVYVSSNDPSNSEIRLSFTANIVKEKVSGPKLFIESTEHNFGKVNEGKVLDWNVNVKNIGNELLEIKDVKTSCGCTAAVLSGNKLKPGESGNLKVEFDTSNRSGLTSRTITLFTNDTKQPNQTIMISADIQKQD